jgi:hypothetical protein
MNIQNFINDVILEASLDARIADGVLDMKNHEHILVLAELMYDKCGDENIVNEFVTKFMAEGKYPDRQAFNKEGWLVTFPSKEYRDAAIKKGTHSISDPTHGKGGMNLYYKRRGKQKRQTQQASTQTEPQKTTNTTQQVKQKVPQPEKPKQGVDVSKLAPDVQRAYKDAIGAKEEPATTEPTPQPTEKPSTTTTPQSNEPTQAPEAPRPAEAPTIDVPVVTEPPAQYADISKKFATKKGWMAEPYGEYRDAEGNTVAVVGLSGEVVPVKSNDREEYKLFAEKSKV